MEAVRKTVIVQLGGRIEIVDVSLPVGKEVEIIVSVPNGTGDLEATPRRTILDVLAEARGGLIFKTAEQVDAYIREERDA